MNKTVLLVIWLLIWFYAGIAYVWMNQQEENKRMENIELGISSLNDKFDNWLTITITD